MDPLKRPAGVVEILEQAIQKKEPIKIKYHGGSHPGTVREIMPVGFSKNKVRARCLITDQFKMFNLEKIELISCDKPEITWTDSEQREIENTTFHSIQDMLERKKSEFENMGYIVINDEKSIKLHRLEKSKISKCCYSSIEQFEQEGNFVIFIQVADLSKPLVGNKKNENLIKWRVCCLLKSMKSYNNFEKAAKAFYQRSIELASRLKEEGE